jgi:cell division protein FtsQ
MLRTRRPSLRGSVQQNNRSVRVRPREPVRFGFLMRVGIGGGVVLLAVILGFFGWHSGWFHRQAAHLAESGLRLTQKAHFAVNDIIVEGRQHTDRDQLFVALEAPAKSPIFAFDPAAAEARIARLSWIDSVTVERRLPDTIYVRLSERAPLARWQDNGRISVIDTMGKVLPDADPNGFGQLPLIVGTGAPAGAEALFESLRRFPMVGRLVTASVRVGERRWDLHLQGKIVARLPEGDIAAALKRLSILITDEKILERDIVAIDLRIPDRLILESGGAPPAQRPDNHL